MCDAAKKQRHVSGTLDFFLPPGVVQWLATYSSSPLTKGSLLL